VLTTEAAGANPSGTAAPAAIADDRPSTGDLHEDGAAGHGERERVRWGPVLAVAAALAVARLGVATRYGWHRDEFYYVMCGRHLAWGYPDQPPVAPLLARLASEFGSGLLALRLMAIGAEVGCVLLAAVLARQLGGRWRAQALTAGAVAACPVFLGASSLFGTTVLDQLAWLVVLAVLNRALRTRRVVDWVWVGVAAGAGLETKNTIAVLLAGVAVGLALTRPAELRSPGPWLAAVLALVLWAPNLAWDATHGWANLHMAAVLARGQGGAVGSLEQLPLLLVLLAGPFLVWLWVLGARRLASAAGRTHRWTVVAAAVVVVAFTAGGGKPYYPAPMFAALFAAGAVTVEERLGAAGSLRRTAWPVGIALSGVGAALGTLPFLPPAAASAMSRLDPTLIETYGWPQLAAEVASYARHLPAGASVLTSNYGEAGALERFGPPAGLRLAVVSGHNAYGWWGPPTGNDSTVLAVGEWPASYLGRFWAEVTPVAPVRMGGVRDEETTGSYGHTHPAAIFLCQKPRGTWSQLWPALRHLD